MVLANPTYLRLYRVYADTIHLVIYSVLYDFGQPDLYCLSPTYTSAHT